MRRSTYLCNLAAVDEGIPPDVSTCGDIPTIVSGYRSAGNDASCEDPVIPKDDVEAWAQHARAANGFGDAATADTATSARPTSYALYHAARSHRSFALGEIILAMIQAAVASVREAHARYRERRQALATYRELRQLDDHMLRDLGFYRSATTPVAVDVTREAELARLRALPLFFDLP